MKKIKSNKKLLLELLQEESTFGYEDKVRKIIIQELKSLGFTYSVDKIGNISAIRGDAKKYPLLNAHMDIVDLTFSYWKYSYSSPYNYDMYDYCDIPYQIIDTFDIETIRTIVSCKHCLYDCKTKKVCEEFEPTYVGEEVLLKWAEKLGMTDYFLNNLYNYGEDDSPYKVFEKDGIIKGKGKNRVLGGDDKCGIFIALEVARFTECPMKLLFTVGEEEGCIGIKDFIKNNGDWFKDVAYSLTIDRRAGDNLLWSQLGVRSCTRAFASRVAVAGIKEGIPVKVQDGSVADVVYIRELVKNALNMSAGYYSAHNTDEYIVWDEVVKIIKWVRRFVLEEAV